jgi:hypothetical protein
MTPVGALFDPRPPVLGSPRTRMQGAGTVVCGRPQQRWARTEQSNQSIIDTRVPVVVPQRAA